MARTRNIRPQRFDLVGIEWVDCEQEYEWTDYASFKSKDPPIMLSVGFLYSNEKNRIVIFQTVDKDLISSGDGLFDSILTIPKCSVKKVTLIKRYSNKTHEPRYNRK